MVVSIVRVAARNTRRRVAFRLIGMSTAVDFSGAVGCQAALLLFYRLES